MSWPICPDCGGHELRTNQNVTYDVRPDGVTRWRAYSCPCGWAGLSAEEIRSEGPPLDPRKMGDPYHLAPWGTLRLRRPRSCVSSHRTLMRRILGARKVTP